MTIFMAPLRNPGPFSRIRTWLWVRGWWPDSRRWIPMGTMEREVDE